MLDHLKIPCDLPSAEKLLLLRESSAEELVNATEKLRVHEFRAVSDNHFVSSEMFHKIDDGSFARLLKKHHIPLLLSEVRDERTSYAEWRTPKESSLKAVRTRLQADYPETAVDVIIQHFCPGAGLPDGCSDWTSAFGKMYAAMQVHLTQRGFADKIVAGGAGDLLRRVRSEWMTSGTKKWTPQEMGVTHGTDSAIWFWGNGDQLSKEEQKIIREFVGEVFWSYLSGKDVEKLSWWRELKGKPQHMRRLGPDGKSGSWLDPSWQEGVDLWEALSGIRH